MGLMASIYLFAKRQYEIGRYAHTAYQSRTYDNQQEAADEISRRCAVFFEIEAIRDCLREQIRTYQAEDNSDEDLQAQKDMALWALWVAATGGVGLIVSFLGLLAVYLSLRQTRKAISIDREVGHAQARAYLDIASTEVVRLKPEGETEIKIRIFNSGVTPARDVKVSYYFKFDSGGGAGQEDPAAHNIAGNGSYIIEKTFFFHDEKTLTDHYRTSSTKIMTVKGSFSYKDVFSEVRVLKFSYHLTAENFYPVAVGTRISMTIDAEGNSST